MVFEALSSFTKSVTRLLDDENYAGLQYALAANPARSGKSSADQVACAKCAGRPPDEARAAASG